jgi:hypothetical protein
MEAVGTGRLIITGIPSGDALYRDFTERLQINLRKRRQASKLSIVPNGFFSFDSSRLRHQVQHVTPPSL